MWCCRGLINLEPGMQLLTKKLIKTALGQILNICQANGILWLVALDHLLKRCLSTTFRHFALCSTSSIILAGLLKLLCFILTLFPFSFIAKFCFPLSLGTEPKNCYCLLCYLLWIDIPNLSQKDSLFEKFGHVINPLTPGAFRQKHIF